MAPVIGSAAAHSIRLSRLLALAWSLTLGLAPLPLALTLPLLPLALSLLTARSAPSVLLGPDPLLERLQPAHQLAGLLQRALPPSFFRFGKRTSGFAQPAGDIVEVSGDLPLDPLRELG